MKNPQDPRHQARIRIVQQLFARQFQPQLPPAFPALSAIEKKLPEIDKTIVRFAPEWPLSQINRVDLAILRLAVYELLIARKEPSGVVIDEAIELAKTFGGENSPKFINGVLGALLKSKN